MTRKVAIALVGVVIASSVAGADAFAQSFGIELHNSLMPASGAMAGASIARPQDLTSAIAANPATLTQFRGTQFSFGGAWVEATYRVAHTGGVIPTVGAFNAKSGRPGSPVGNIGVVQDFTALGIPATLGIGFITNAGAGVEFRAVPESNGTSLEYLSLDMTVGTGVSLTERLSAGASIALGISTLDGLFVGTSAAVPDYALRGTVGLGYDVGRDTTLGVYWQTKKSHTFDNAILLAGVPGATFRDIQFDHPENLGFGIANSSLMDGRLLLAFDLLYKQHEKADFLRAVYRDQWVYLFGAQYRLGPRCRLRLGYAYNENPIDPDPLGSAGGVTPPAADAAMRYIQAQVAVISQHRLTGGIGIRDLLPGVDLDLFAGGMFKAEQQFGAYSAASIESYWIGSGLTWRFGRGSCQRLPVPDDWSRTCCQ